MKVWQSDQDAIPCAPQVNTLPHMVTATINENHQLSLICKESRYGYRYILACRAVVESCEMMTFSMILRRCGIDLSLQDGGITLEPHSNKP